ncbi:type I restriction endonuclease subunit R, EcoR124 family, partial [Staphylococcus epidermidis]
DEHLRLKSDLIREFLDDIIPTLSVDADIREMYYRFEERKKREEIKSFAVAKAFSAKLLERFINEYEYSGQINKSEIDKETKGSLLLRNKT